MMRHPRSLLCSGVPACAAICLPLARQLLHHSLASCVPGSQAAPPPPPPTPPPPSAPLACRYYRNALVGLQRAADAWREAGVDCVIHMGDILGEGRSPSLLPPCSGC